MFSTGFASIDQPPEAVFACTTMKAKLLILLLVCSVLVLAAASFFGMADSDPPAKTAPASVKGKALPSKAISGPALPGLTTIPSSRTTSEPSSASSAASMPEMERRIIALEAEVKALREALSGVSLEKASADRQKLFATAEGYLKADEYAAAGQHAIAGEGYLTFLQHHPQHPDARDVMKKARDSFLKAGYKDKAFWVQEEMMKANPQHQLADLEELAHIEKEAGIYDRASQHMQQAAQLDPNAESRLWKRMYWAWFVQLHEGNTAGLNALRQVRQEIVTSGVNNPTLNQRLEQHMIEWQRQLTSGQ